MTQQESTGGWTATEVPRLPIDSSVDLAAPRHALDESPLPAEDSGIPTGNLIVEQPASHGHGRRVAGQTAIILGSAMLVGLGVFVGVRAMVASGSDEQVAPVPDDIAIVDPGPIDGPESNAGPDDGSGSGTRRSTTNGSDTSGFSSGSADGQSGDPSNVDGNPPSPVAAERSSADDGSDAASSDPDQERPPAPDDAMPGGPTPGNPIPGGPTTTAGPGATSSPATVRPTPAPGPTSSSPVGNTSVAVTTAAPTTTRPQATTAAPTTASTSAPTTTPTTTATTAAPSTTLPSSLILRPSNGAERRWGRPTQFRAADVGAAEYCWVFSSGAGMFERCSSSRNYTLPGRSDDVASGPVTVTATARGAGGELIMRQRISITLRARGGAANTGS